MSDDLLEQFLIEGREQADLAEGGLAGLRRSPSDPEALATCFRAVHTLKGSAGLLALAPMARLLHRAEDLLAALSRRPPDPGDLDFLSRALDQTDRWLAELSLAGRLAEDAERRLAVLLSEPEAAVADEAAISAGQGPVSIRYSPRPDAYFAGDDPLEIIRQVPGLSQLRITAREPWGPAEAYDPFVCNLLIEAVSDAPMAQVAASFRFVADQVVLSQVEAEPPEPPELPEPGEPGEPGAPGAPIDARARTVRIDVDHVDRLSAVADELVAALGGLEALAAQAAALPDGAALAQAIRDQQAVQDRLAARLHGAAGRLRLAPLSPLFARFPRLVREIAQDLGKTVEFEADPADAELDRSLADGLFEPLLHVLRNAVDHGLEAPAARRAAGKPERGRIRLQAQAQADEVLVTVEDDGGGLDPGGLRQAAAARGLLSPDQVQALSDREALDLIFLPGLSTRQAATQISGRGVGMDAVRRAIERLGGQVGVSSRPGAGTQVRFVLPLAVKLSRILVVACGAERYGLDMAEVLEAVRPPAEALTPIRAGVGFVWRDQPVPLLSLARLAGLDAPAPLEGSSVLILRTSQGPVGLAVDATGERIQALVRPPSGVLASLPVVTGVTLLADGGALLVLSPEELRRWA